MKRVDEMMSYAECSSVVFDDKLEAAFSYLWFANGGGLIVKVHDAATNHDTSWARFEGRDVCLDVLHFWLPRRVNGRVERCVHLFWGEAVSNSRR